MSTNSKIEWTDSTWNPVRGCTRVSAGCQNCFAERMASRFWPELATRTPNGPRWTGKVEFREDELTKPLHWRKPRRVFVCSMGDLFHGNVSSGMLDAIFATMALCPQHTFQVLTKRPAIAWEYMTGDGLVGGPMGRMTRVDNAMMNIACDDGPPFRWPLPNVWLGVSVENQEAADERIPVLLQTPASVRFLSCEPLLEEMDLSGFFGGPYVALPGDRVVASYNFGVDWVICGGETGPHKRPMDLDWARILVAQCRAADVPFFFKQDGNGGYTLDGREYHEYPEGGALR